MYKKQRNYVAGLNKVKFEYFNNQDCKKGTKPFWDKCKPFFSNKHRRGYTNIIFKKKEELLLKKQYSRYYL